MWFVSTRTILHALVTLAVSVVAPATCLVLAAIPAVQITLLNVPPFYEPPRAQAYAGAVIEWHNATSTHHTITHDECSRGSRCLFQSGPIPPNGSFTVPGLPSGRYPYHCQIHPFMRGVLMIVKSAVQPEQM